MPPHPTVSRSERALALVVLALGSLVLLATSQRKWEKKAEVKRTLQGPTATLGVKARAVIPAQVARDARTVAMCARVVSSMGKDPAHLVVQRVAPPHDRHEGRFEAPYNQGEEARACAPCEGRACEQVYWFRLEKVPSETVEYELSVSVEARGPYPEPARNVRLIVQ